MGWREFFLNSRQKKPSLCRAAHRACPQTRAALVEVILEVILDLSIDEQQAQSDQSSLALYRDLAKGQPQQCLFAARHGIWVASCSRQHGLVIFRCWDLYSLTCRAEK